MSRLLLNSKLTQQTSVLLVSFICNGEIIMEVNHHYQYDPDKSVQRIKDILGANNSNFPRFNKIPARDNLTFKTGCYVDVTALFIDIVGSSKLTEVHKRTTLAKIYNCFISESIAVMSGSMLCKELSINGDCVWGAFDTHSKADFDAVFNVTLQLNTTINALNNELVKKYSKIEVGIGMDYGLALMTKAGYAGSGLNDVIWMGDVVNTACHLANKAGRQGKSPILISENIYSKLSDSNKGCFSCLINFDGIPYYEYYKQQSVEWFDYLLTKNIK